MKPELKNEPAFPVIFYGTDSIGEVKPQEQYSGMTLRDYFAANAMTNHACNSWDFEKIAEYSYKIADAMLKERNKDITNE